MAVTVSRLEAVLTARTEQFDKSMDRSEGRMGKVGKAAGVAGLAIAGGLAVGIEKSVHAAMAAQVSTARLEQAFKTAHLSASVYAKAIDAAESSGRKLGFTDEQTKDSLGSLLVATHSMSKATADLSVAQDISRFKHVDLTASTKMLAMAMAGSQRATKQLGISVQPVTTNYDTLKATMGKTIDAHEKLQLASAKLIDKQATSALVIDTVKQKLGGQADAYSKTAAGGMEQFHAQLDHLEVKMGTGLLPILARVASAVSAGTEYFSKHATMAKVVVGALGALAFALMAARTAQLLMNLSVLANPYVAAGVAIVAFGVLIYHFRDKLMNVFDWIKAHYPLLTAIIAGPIGLAVAEIIKHRDAIASAFTSLPGKIGDAIGGAIGALKNKLADIFDWHRIVKWIKEALGFHSPSPFFMAIGHDIVDSMVKGVGDAAGVLKSAVVRLAKDSIPSIPGITSGFGGPGIVHPGKGGETLSTLIPWAKSEGMTITSTTGGKHAAGSYHYQSRAIDVAGSPSQMKKFFLDSLAHFGVGQIKELFYDPMHEYVKNGSLRMGEIGGHSDHVHLALGAGGIVTKAMTALLGERGPEAVIPLSSPRGQTALAGAGHGGNTYNVNLSFPGYVGDESVVAAVVRDAMEQFQNRNGRPAFGTGF
jgi:hypothetical protein